MAALASETGGLLAHSLMIIIGTPFEKLALATYAFSQSELLQRVFRRTCVVTFPPCSLSVDRLSERADIGGVAVRFLRKILGV
jgi:hypothetical protein